MHVRSLSNHESVSLIDSFCLEGSLKLYGHHEVFFNLHFSFFQSPLFLISKRVLYQLVLSFLSLVMDSNHFYFVCVFLGRVSVV